MYKKNNPSLSVVMCVNRSNPFLGEAIQSILIQTYANFEFLIGANACPDELLEELNSLVEADPRVKIVRTSLPQLSFTLNNLIELASGDWIIRMDSDDISESNRLERFLIYADKSKASIIGTWTNYINSDNKIIGTFRPQVSSTDIRRWFFLQSQISHPSVAFKRDLWIKMRGYMTSFASEDYDLWLRSILVGELIENIPEVLLSYRIHNNQESRDTTCYSAIASYWYREFLIKPSFYLFFGFIVATLKAIILPTLKSISRSFMKYRI